MATLEIPYFNRDTGQIESEKVYGGGAVRFAYSTLIGKALGAIISSRCLSRLYGRLQDSAGSRKKIEPFIENFQIPMQHYENPGYKSFNDFFIRRFKPGMRPVVGEKDRLAAFAEARYLAWESIKDEQTFPVKGVHLSATALLGSEEKAKPFIGGPLLIARLCPVDYHRYHYPDDGTTLDSYPIHGSYHSVNPIALEHRSDLFISNERRVSLLQTNHFGKLAFIEVGATMVGKIIQTHDESKPFVKGAEKGYFLFGGSTVILIGEPGRWKPDDDLLAKTEEQMEVLIQLGDGIAKVL
jgi:phosphatidylserine decarboxylase